MPRSATPASKRSSSRSCAIWSPVAGPPGSSSWRPPSADIVPTSLRDLFGYRWAFRCSTDASSDTILGHGWASAGYTAAAIDPAARGVGWLLAEGGIPRRVKSAYLSDADVARLAAHAALRRSGGSV